MKKLAIGFTLAATLSAQQSVSTEYRERSYVVLEGVRGTNPVGSRLESGYTEAGVGVQMLATKTGAGLGPTNSEGPDGNLYRSARPESFDNNGALEAFYKPHHSHRKAWLTIGILIGSGVATGLLATRASHPPIGRPIMPAMPAPVTPVFGGVSFIGIGGPGVPVTIAKGGRN